MTTKITVPERYKGVQAASGNYAGLMGLSVGKQQFMNPAIMEHYARFMQDRFTHSVLLVWDYPKKYNIMALDGLDEDAAEGRALMAGNQLRSNLEKVTRDFPTVKVARWRHFMTPKYQHNLQVMRRAYEEDTEFRESCKELTLDFLSLPENKAKWKDPNNPPIDIAKEYVLDELAGLIAAPFAFRLPLCEIYPGRNEPHERVQNREFEFCKDLHIKDDRVFMEVYHGS